MKKRTTLFILIVIIAISIFIIPFILKIETFECKTQYSVCSDSINKELEQIKGKNLISAKNKIKLILQKNHYISDFSIHFKLPNIIKIQTVVRKPIYSIKKNETNERILISREGLVLSNSNESDLPTLNVSYDIAKVGNNISQRELFALNILLGVKDMYQVNTGNIINDSLVVELPGSVNVIFPLEGEDRDYLLGSLRLIYSKIQNESAVYREIDLRFKNPVLR